MKVLSNTITLASNTNVFGARTVRLTNSGESNVITLSGDGNSVLFRVRANETIFFEKKPNEIVSCNTDANNVYAESVTYTESTFDEYVPGGVVYDFETLLTRTRVERVAGGGMIRRNLTLAGNPSKKAIELMDTTFAAQYTDNVDRTQFLHGGDETGDNMGSTIYVTGSGNTDNAIILRDIRPRQDHDRARESAQGYVAESMRTWTDMSLLPVDLIGWTNYKFDRTIHEEQVQGAGQVRRRGGTSSWSIELRNAQWNQQFTNAANTEFLTTGKSIFVANGNEETEIRLAGANGSTAFWVNGDYGGNLLNRGVDNWVDYKYYRESTS